MNGPCDLHIAAPGTKTHVRAFRENRLGERVMVIPELHGALLKVQPLRQRLQRIVLKAQRRAIRHGDPLEVDVRLTKNDLISSDRERMVARDLRTTRVHAAVILGHIPATRAAHLRITDKLNRVDATCGIPGHGTVVDERALARRARTRNLELLVVRHQRLGRAIAADVQIERTALLDPYGNIGTSEQIVRRGRGLEGAAPDDKRLLIEPCAHPDRGAVLDRNLPRALDWAARKGIRAARDRDRARRHAALGHLNLAGSHRPEQDVAALRKQRRRTERIEPVQGRPVPRHAGRTRPRERLRSGRVIRQRVHYSPPRRQDCEGRTDLQNRRDLSSHPNPPSFNFNSALFYHK